MEGFEGSKGMFSAHSISSGGEAQLTTCQTVTTLR